MSDNHGVRTEGQRSDVLPLMGPRRDAEAQDGVPKLDDADDWVGPLSILPVGRLVFDRSCGSGSTLIARWNSPKLALPPRQSFRLQVRVDMRASTTRSTALPLRPGSVRRMA
jgi:hypothetical protein